MRLDREVLEFIDIPVRLGIYDSLSEALRELIKVDVEEFKWIAKVAEAAEKLFELEREGEEIPIKLEAP